MKTFADVKRRLKLGVVLECVENTYRPEIAGSRRTIAKVQTNSIACTHDGEERLFWTNFPKASGVTIVDQDTFRFSLGDAFKGVQHFVTLRFC